MTFWGFLGIAALFNAILTAYILSDTKKETKKPKKKKVSKTTSPGYLGFVSQEEEDDDE